ncbi:uncharacterized protein (TIGR02453 family) [Salinibacter ruber]|uniref:DUF2461 domain-containing protein n=1 Tax=Salinibacter ruber TaxID=146919 RepID=UPI000E567A28|nr:DUF2461 domain-containing protein [Salinibacter ruber]MCS3700785.1 uncharacterized protein (TIGR02453 family) [Salinibacter ruber]MCS3938994.1 uncharacterized protein (TIGR02453 family) [Salinibacter ruber]
MAELLSRPPFPGFRPEAFAFLRALADHNDRDWFKARKETYEAELKDPLELLLIDGARRLAETDLPLTAHPKKSRFRIYRDMRFTDDKTPYKTHVSGVFDRSGQRDENGVVYVHVEPDYCFLGAGFYQPSVSYLRPVRERIAAEPERFFELLDEMKGRGLPVHSMEDTLTGMPKGFSDYRDTPIAPYLKWKNYVVKRDYPEEALQSPDFAGEVVRMARDVRPLLTFVWAVEPSS